MTPPERLTPMPSTSLATADAGAPPVDAAPAPARDTRFRLGNTAWARRRSPGRRRRFADPEALEAACDGYFRWAAEHPLVRLEPVVWRGTVTMVLEVPQLRPITLTGLCAHLGIGCQTWRDYRRRPAFPEVIERVEDLILLEQFESAAIGLLDSRIISRSLALGHFR